MSVPGVLYYPEFLPEALEKEIITELDSLPWSNQLKRRTQHYGYIYDYRSRSLPKATTPLSPSLLKVAKLLPFEPTQCIVNEYLRNQGISAHTDSRVFGPIIASVSLLAPCEMIFTSGSRVFTLTLMPRSLLILSGEAREDWKHEIKGNVKVSLPDGTIYHKPEDYRRVSLTFRTLA